MKIDRSEDQGGSSEAMKRISFCLDQLEASSEFKNNLHWESDIVSRCTLEEIIGALVCAEQFLEARNSTKPCKMNTTK